MKVMKVTLQKKKRKVIIAPATKKDLLCGSFNAVGNPAAVEFYRNISEMWMNFKKVIRMLK